MNRVLGDGKWYDAENTALVGSVCTSCGTLSFPPRAFCWRCSSGMRWERLPRAGRVIARSRVHISAEGFPEAYEVGVVELAADLHVLARFGETAPDPGATVTVRTGRLREDPDGPVDGPVFVADSVARPAAVPQAGQPEPQLRSLAPLAPVTIGGVATTAFGRPDLPIEDLAAAAALAAVKDSGLTNTDVDAVVVGSAFGTAALGQRMLRHVPWGGRRLINVENACASGTSALAEAIALIRSGAAEVVVAVGADTPVRAGGGLIPLDRDDPVAGIGVTLPALYALVGERYRSRYGVSTDAFAEVVVRGRENAAHNPDAFRRDPVTREQVLRSRMIADPITLYQCAPNADGAAAVVVVADHRRSGTAERPVEIASLALHSGFAKDRFTGSSVVDRVARSVYAQAGVEPADIEVVELHDAFAPAALTNLEALGLAAPGTAGHRLLAGDFRVTGQGPVLNPSGGLISRGHPPGATGLAQVAELTRQLRGQAGERQVGDVSTALLQTMGGTVLELETNACAIGVLKRA